MKGIILAGGLGTRLYPMTVSLSKQLLPIYDKPMIYYPLSVLMYSGIREILIITTSNHIKLYETLLGDGKQIGIKIKYQIQNEPRGLVDAFILGEEFIGSDSVCLMLGDNLLHGDGLLNLISKSKEQVDKYENAVVYGYCVSNPQDYGIISFDSEKNIISIEEKPKNPKSNYAVIGLYIYPNDVVSKSKLVKPSERGEIEITSLNNMYLNENRLKMMSLGRGFSWFDTGTNYSLVEASNFIMSIEKRSGLKVGCIEEIALIKKFISLEDFSTLIDNLKDCEYKRYLKKILNNHN